MEILNDIPEEKYLEIDEFLAYIGIYDDEARLKAYLDHLRKLDLNGKIIVEAGAGFGFMTKEIAKMGAKRIYAVESNKLTFKVLSAKVKHIKTIRPINTRIEDFRPNEPVDILVHEFYGSMLYDENLFSLERLKFSPKSVFPNGGELRVAVLNSMDFVDSTVDRTVLQELKGVIVGDLFPEPELSDSDFKYLVAEWQFGKGLRTYVLDLSDVEGDLLAFAVFIKHNDKTICTPIRCTNWSIGWTPRAGDRLVIEFEVSDDYSRTKMRWAK